MNPPPLLIAGAFVLLSVALWIAILVLGARYGGWSALARQYLGPDTIAGDVCTYANARFRWFYGYNRCLTITISQQGVHMRPMFAYRLHHPPLLIPWEAVIQMQNKSVALFPRADVIIRSTDPAAPFTIGFKGKRLVETLFRNWPGPSG